MRALGFLMMLAGSVGLWLIPAGVSIGVAILGLVTVMGLALCRDM